MSQCQITPDETLLQCLIQNDGLKPLMETQAGLAALDTLGQLQAAPYDHSDERQGYRNGYREHSLLIEMVIAGVSTHKVSAVVEELCALRSPSPASQHCVND